MTDLHCPTCKTELMQHQSTLCLENWVNHAVFDREGSVNLYAFDIVSAYKLMEWVWERDPWARIHNDRIELEAERTPLGSITVRIITGPTFPLRVCRAAIFLASQKENTK